MSCSGNWSLNQYRPRSAIHSAHCLDRTLRRSDQRQAAQPPKQRADRGEYTDLGPAPPLTLPPSRTLPLIMLIPPQPLHQGLMGYPMVTPHQKGPQTARIGVADGRMLAQGAQLQEGGPGNAQQAAHLPRAIDPRARDAGRPQEVRELALGLGAEGGGGSGVPTLRRGPLALASLTIGLIALPRYAPWSQARPGRSRAGRRGAGAGQPAPRPPPAKWSMPAWTSGMAATRRASPRRPHRGSDRGRPGPCRRRAGHSMASNCPVTSWPRTSAQPVKA